MNRDLTIGKPESVLWRFCLPLFGSVLFQQLYNIADSLVAGKFIGENALAAVGNSYEITLIFIAFAFGSNIGCSVILSQLFGARRYRELKTAVSTAFLACAALCALLMLFGIAFGSVLLRLIQTPEEIFTDSARYLRIYCWGLPFMFFYNLATGVFSALGDSRTPFIFLAVSSLSNILVDVLFVTRLRMGVAGVAWATFLCQGVSCVLALGFVFRRVCRLPAQEKHEWFSLPMLGRIARIAIPSILQQSFISVGNLIIQGAINGFGASVIAGYSAGVKFNNMVITSFTTIGNGISNYTAQNLGAKKPERVGQGLRAGLKMVWLFSAVLFSAYFFAARPLLSLFMNGESEAASATGVQFLRILSPFYFVVSCKLAVDGVLRGAGCMKQFMAATFTDLAMRVVLALILSRFFGPVGIWSAWPISWTVATAMSIGFYRRGAWKKASV